MSLAVIDISVIFFFKILLSLPVYLLFKLALGTKRKTNQNYGFIFPIGIILTFLIIIYLQYYPLDSFYIEQFEEGVRFKMPESGKIVEKISAEVFLRWEYRSAAMIEFSEEDYNYLLQKIKNSDCFTKDSIFHCNSEFDDLFENYHKSDFIIYNGKCGDWFYLAFHKDKKIIFFFHDNC